MTPEQGILVIQDYIIKGTVHPHYNYMVEQAMWCQQVFSGVGQETFVRAIRESETKEQKDFRVKVSYPETPEVLEGVQTIVQRVFRVDGITEKVDHSNEGQKTEIQDVTRNFSILGNPTRYLQDRQTYYEFVDPNAWLIIDRYDTRDENGNVLSVGTYPLELGCESVINYGYGPSKPKWALVRSYNEFGKSKRELLHFYAAGFVLTARELKDKEAHDVETESLLVHDTKRYALSQYLNDTKEFPGDKFGAYNDPSVKDMTVRASIYNPARNILKRIIRNSSLASVQLMAHVYPKVYAYDEPCDYEGSRGRGCGHHDEIDPRCPKCGGTGSSFHKSSLDITRVALPDIDDKTKEFISLSELIHYVDVPTEPTRLILERLDSDKRYVPFSVFNSQQVEQPLVSTTATEQRFNWENANNRIQPFVTRNEYLHMIIYRATAEHLAFDDGFVYDYSYPKALDLEPEDAIISRYDQARKANLPGLLVSSIGNELIIKRMGSDNIAARNYSALQKFRPLASFDTNSALSILQSREVTDPDRVLFENWDKVWCVIQNENPGFFSLDYNAQKTYIEQVTQSILENIQYISVNVELPPLDLLGEGLGEQAPQTPDNAA